MLMIEELHAVNRKHQYSHLDSIKDFCLLTLNSERCLSYEHAFFRDVLAYADDWQAKHLENVRKKVGAANKAHRNAKGKGSK